MSNPFTKSSNIDKEARKYASDRCVVQNVSNNAGHSVVVQIKDDQENLFPVTILIDSVGDIHVPEVGDTVIVGYTKGGVPYIIGTVYTSDVPTYDTEERRIASRGDITLDANGVTVTVKSNGDIVINEGTENPITDIQTTMTDGYVSDIQLTKAENIYL